MKLVKILGLAFLVLLAASCATKKEIVLTGDIVKVSGDELSNYWVPKKDKFSFNLNMPKKGYVKYRYIIDSNGNLFNPEIVESNPEGMVDHAGLVALSKIKYIPAKSNIKQIPVQVETEIRFE